jgi:ATPase subunit of ABC transporter with duplicated ATPase domains
MRLPIIWILKTRQHVIEVLKNYPGAMIVISHDEDFLEEIGIDDDYQIENGILTSYNSLRSKEK